MRAKGEGLTASAGVRCEHFGSAETGAPVVFGEVAGGAWTAW